MLLRIKFSEEGKRGLQSLHIDIQRNIKDTLKKLASGEIKGKELTAQLLGFYSLKVDNYRVIYRKLSEEIIVYHVGHRSNVYRSFGKN